LTENELMQYNALKARVSRNRNRIYDINTKDVPVVEGKVKGSSKYFPYIETHYKVRMNDPVEVDRCNKRIKELEKSINKDIESIKRIESYISNISDPKIQTIFEMRVYEKMKWMDIAIELDEDKDRTTYSKKFKNYIENSHNSPISQ
jgi:hypothetical protein